MKVEMTFERTLPASTIASHVAKRLRSLPKDVRSLKYDYETLDDYIEWLDDLEHMGGEASHDHLRVSLSNIYNWAEANNLQLKIHLVE